MLYLIDEKYYVKSCGKFVEVEVVRNGNDVDLRPTNNTLEIDKNKEYERVTFNSLKDDVVEEEKDEEVFEENLETRRYHNKKHK